MPCCSRKNFCLREPWNCLPHAASTFFHRADNRPYLVIPPADAVSFHEICFQLLREYRDTAYGRLTILQSLLNIFLVHAQRYYSHSHLASVETSVADNLIEAYIRLIDLHFIDKQQVHDYAALLGVTPVHLTDSCRQLMGIPASQLIFQRVIVEAKRLLAYSDQTIAEIGYALNFNDPSYFARFFKRESGLTPIAFRRDIREKYQLLRNRSL